jgi:hypothetical protein
MKPALQAHLWPSGMLVQSALTLQPPLLVPQWTTAANAKQCWRGTGVTAQHDACWCTVPCYQSAASITVTTRGLGRRAANTRSHVQVKPVPVKSGLQSHPRLPGVLVQVALALQPPLLVAHSLMSASTEHVGARGIHITDVCSGHSMCGRRAAHSTTVACMLLPTQTGDCSSLPPSIPTSPLLPAISQTRGLWAHRLWCCVWSDLIMI